jgi:WD40 repeat protein
MDLCEIENPLCIATCGMDRRILMYSLKENYKIRVIEGDHEKGIKRMSYTPVNGGYLISIGYEIFANVWCPESVVGDILIGKLKGHSRPIIDSKFIGSTIFNVTIDENKEIRIWDIKSSSCLQFVKPTITTRVQGLITLSNKIFWIYGKRFIKRFKNVNRF